MTGKERIETIKHLGSFVRVGRNGPIFILDTLDHARDTFAVRNIANGARSSLTVAELFTAIQDGIAHIRRCDRG